jgi:hypothetical protein
MVKLYWTGYSHHERTAAISAIQEIVAKYGSIVDFKLFSDLALALVIEVDGNKIDALHQDLSRELQMDAIPVEEVQSSTESTILFNITFGKGTGNMKQTIIEVPG